MLTFWSLEFLCQAVTFFARHTSSSTWTRAFTSGCIVRGEFFKVYLVLGLVSVGRTFFLCSFCWRCYGHLMNDFYCSSTVYRRIWCRLWQLSNVILRREFSWKVHPLWWWLSSITLKPLFGLNHCSFALSIGLPPTFPQSMLISWAGKRGLWGAGWRIVTLTWWP